MNTPAFKPTIAVDFDGVIHDYNHGWKDGTIYGQATEGFFDWLISVKRHFEIVVFSTRSSTPVGVQAMKTWFYDQLRRYPLQAAELKVGDILFAHDKPKASIIIDDRAIRFEGDWSAPEFSVESLKNFKPWNAS